MWIKIVNFIDFWAWYLDAIKEIESNTGNFIIAIYGNIKIVIIQIFWMVTIFSYDSTFNEPC